MAVGNNSVTLLALPTCDDGHLALQLVSTLVVVPDEDGLGFLQHHRHGAQSLPTVAR